MSDEYRVQTKGFLMVEADNEEKAEEKAWEQIRPGGKHEVTGVEAFPNFREDNTFKIKLLELGTNRASRDYSTFFDKSALRLAFTAVRQIADAFVGKKSAAGFKYDLACLILSDLEGDKVNGEDIMEKRQEFRDNGKEHGIKGLEKYWKIKEKDKDEEAFKQ